MSSAMRSKSPPASRKSARSVERSSSRRKPATVEALGRSSARRSPARSGRPRARQQIEEQPRVERDPGAARSVDGGAGARVHRRRQRVRHGHLELAQVPGPRVPQHRGPGLAGQHEDDRRVGLAGVLLGEREREGALGLRPPGRPDQGGDRAAVARAVEEGGGREPRELRKILAPLGQRRQLQRERRIQPHEQVGAKAPLDDAPAEVGVGGGDDARGVRRLRGAAEAPDRPVVQRRQEHLLRVGGQVLDLVQKQRAVGRGLEDAGAVRDGPGEGAAQRAEQCGLEQPLRHRRAVEGHEGARAPREGMDHVADQEALARSRRSGDEQRHRASARARRPCGAAPASPG